MLEQVWSSGEPSEERVFLAKTRDGHLVEFAESWSPPHLETPAWVISVSPSLGCPVRCVFCDGGGFYKGKLNASEILAQLDHVIALSADAKDPELKLWVEFSKVGEPSFNPGVLEVLWLLPDRYGARTVAPVVSSVAPDRTEGFFEQLREVRHGLYGPEDFQLRFSLHSSDEAARKKLIPIKAWSFERIADYGRRFFRPGDRKIALRFAASPSFPVSVEALEGIFSPELFSIELTPVSPTQTSRALGFTSRVTGEDLTGSFRLVDEFRAAGFDVAICFGTPRADAVGASCGMSLASRLDTPLPPRRRH